MDRIPGVYRDVVLKEEIDPSPVVAGDPYCLSLLKHHRSLMPMAMEAHKPIFFLNLLTAQSVLTLKRLEAAIRTLKNLHPK